MIIFTFGMQITNPVYHNRPISHQVLVSLLQAYKYPNDKIHEMMNKGELIPLKRGLYIWGETQSAEPFAIANVLYGPSYISAESALAFHSLIPEQVFTTVSMTTKTARKFANEVGIFEYKHLPSPYYAFGIRYEKLGNEQFAMVATGEKALFDTIVTTTGILLRSTEGARQYMLENLRMEAGQLQSFDTVAMQSWIADAPKKESLSFIIKAITSL